MGKEALCFPGLGLRVPFTALTAGMKAYFMGPRGHPGPTEGQWLPLTSFGILLGLIMPSLLEDCGGVQYVCLLRVWPRWAQGGDGSGLQVPMRTELSFCNLKVSPGSQDIHRRCVYSRSLGWGADGR